MRNCFKILMAAVLIAFASGTVSVLAGDDCQGQLGRSGANHGTPADLECRTCHPEPVEDSAAEVADCRTCHDKEKKGKRKCRDCHGEDRFFPSYHRPTAKWKRTHGLRTTALVEPDREPWNLVEPGHVYDCGACHTADGCRKCHQLNRPDSHTGFWRIRGHGINAVAERDSCAYCHDEIFCVRCHRNTKPINHRGKWRTNHGLAAAAGDAERCWVCHPRLITRVRVGNTPECLLCHPP